MDNCYWWIFSKQQEQQQQKFQIKIALKVAKNTISDTRQKINYNFYVIFSKFWK